MSLEPHRIIHFIIALALSFGAAAMAQDVTPPAADPGRTPASVSTAVVRGHVTDPTGALIPGATVSVVDAAGTVVTSAITDSAGSYEIRGLPPGSYVVRAASEGFAQFSSSAIPLALAQAKRVEIVMAIQAEQQNVIVTDEGGPAVSVEAGDNASSVVLKGKDLDALSDDPDELQNELNALAGPSAGPNGGQMYVDGFTGGTLPPKSSIREIRINQSPFSAEFDRIGFGRIEILTKPGTDKFHARGFVQGNDKSFNTDSPIARGNIPEYHSIQFNGNVSGALSKNASYFINFEGRDNQDASVYTAEVPAYDSATGLYYIPYDSSNNIVTVKGGLPSTAKRYQFSPRIDLQLGSKNTLTARFQYLHSSSSGSIGSTALPEQSSSSTSSNYIFQGSDSIIINDHFVDEVRVQLSRSTSSSTPVSTAPSVSVGDALSRGGSGSQSSSSHSDHIEIQNISTLSLGRHAIKFGGWLRDNRQAQFSNSGFNGSFTFKNLEDYVKTLNGTPSASTLSYSTGNEAFKANVFDAAAFFQDDWKYNRFLTLSGGLRLEGQNHVSDHVDVGPRIALAYALDGHKDSRQAKTVLRGGFGFFYDRYAVGGLMSLERNSGGPNSQKQYTITNPACFDSTSLNNLNPSSCGTAASVATTISQLSPSYHSPYTEQIAASVDRQLTKTITLSATYMHSFGVHQTVTRNANAYLQGTFEFGSDTLTGTRPDPSKGIIDETFPEGVFKENQITANVNARLRPKFSLMGFYSLSFANGNTNTASNSYNLKQDYGSASFASRNMVFLMGNYTGPWGVSFNPFLMAQSGRPYSLTTTNDLTGDNFFNNRPAYASSSSCSSGDDRYALTTFGCLDTKPSSNNYTPIPVNLANGPASVVMNLRVSRAFGIGPRNESSNQAFGPRGGFGGFGGGGPRGGGPGGGGPGGPGGGPGPMGGMFGGSNDHKYSLTFSAQAMNLFNNVNYGTPSGVVIPSPIQGTNTYGPGDTFGKSLSLSGGMTSSGSAVRRITIEAIFSF